MASRLIFVFVFLFFFSSSAAPTEQEVRGFVCDVCKQTVLTIQEIALSGGTLDIVESIAIPVCKLINGGGNCQGEWQCNELCTGIVPEFAPVLLEVGAKKLLDPEGICKSISLCSHEIPHASGFFLESLKVVNVSQVKFSTKSLSREQQAQDSNIGSFLTLSDLHIDPKYSEGAPNRCGLPVCCRKEYPSVEGSLPAGKFGDLNCDSGSLMLDSMFEKIKSLEYKPDFVLYTGDSPPHDVWRQSREWNVLTFSE